MGFLVYAVRGYLASLLRRILALGSAREARRHRRQQRRLLAKETTAEQRLEWLEETLFFLWENGLRPSKLPDPTTAGGLADEKSPPAAG